MSSATYFHLLEQLVGARISLCVVVVDFTPTQALGCGLLMSFLPLRHNCFILSVTNPSIALANASARQRTATPVVVVRQSISTAVRQPNRRGNTGFGKSRRPPDDATRQSTTKFTPVSEHARRIHLLQLWTNQACGRNRCCPQRRDQRNAAIITVLAAPSLSRPPAAAVPSTRPTIVHATAHHRNFPLRLDVSRCNQCRRSERGPYRPPHTKSRAPPDFQGTSEPHSARRRITVMAQ